MIRPAELQRPLETDNELVSSHAVDHGFAFAGNPRNTWRGFSFGYYYFYFSFSNRSPSCARGVLMPE